MSFSCLASLSVCPFSWIAWAWVLFSASFRVVNHQVTAAVTGVNALPLISAGKTQDQSSNTDRL